MLRHGRDDAEPITGWPVTEGLVRRALPASGGALVLMGAGKSQRLVYLKDGVFHDRPLPGGAVAIDIAGPDPLWLLGKQKPKLHDLWKNTDAGWRLVHRFTADEAVEMRLIGGAPVVAGTHEGIGAVWGQPGLIGSPDAAAMPIQVPGGPVDPDEARRQIANTLADPRNYVGHGLNLRNMVDKWVMRGLSGEVLAEFLGGPFPEGEVKLLGGRAFASHERFGHWILTWGMRRAGDGRVPPEWLDLPFDEPRNDSEKYFGEKLAAIWTVAATGQDDSATVAGLRRIENDRTVPEWLRQDAAWALHALGKP